MYAKILIILMLAILCTGCTDPVRPDPYEFENVTPGAPALQKSWNPETQTITISTLDGTPRLTIRKVSSNPDLCIFEEVLEINSFVDYNLNKLKDFRARWKKHKGQHDISKVEWFILKNESYHITVNDYETIQVEETHYDNVTEEYYNVTVNQTVLTGNHSEVRYHDIWKPFSPIGKSIHAGQTYTVKIIYHKPPELGNVRIQTIPMFAGIECGELTWWNTSWGYKIDSVVADDSYPYQTTLTVHSASGTNNATDVFLDGHNITNFDDIRFTLGDSTDLSYWIEDNSTDPVKVWVNVTANGTVNMYYGNAAASSTSSGDDTFIQYSGNVATQYLKSVSIPTTQDLRYKSKTKGTGTVKIGISNNQHFPTGDSNYCQIHPGDTYHSSYNDASLSYGSTAGDHTDNVYRIYEGLFLTGVNSKGYFDSTLIATLTTNLPNENIGLGLQIVSGTGAQEWAFLAKYAATEPTWGTWGEEQPSSTITAYTPSTPLQKTAGDSQLFTVNTSGNSQCRWYINDSLKQTNSTGATRHEYTNSSLDEGYWNFTATANTSTGTSSQTWWVTTMSADEFAQDVYAGRWMYVTNLNSTNLNLSQFSTLLNPYYLSFYNATDQKTYNYKSGRWEKYADKIIKPGEAAMLRYTSNATKTRDNAGGTFGFTMKTGLNHIGHSYNGTRNLTWYNTTIASANLVTIEHQNPVDGTVSTFTYGSAANGMIEVLQGFGVEVNVSSDTVISGL